MTADGGFVALSPEEVRALRAFVAEQRPDGAAYDVVLEGTLPGDDPLAAGATVRPYAEAGATWWLEDVWQLLEGPAGGVERMRARIRLGPPPRE